MPMNKPLQQIAYEYECDFKDRVSVAEDDPKVLMVPVDEPSQHFMAGWYAAIDWVRQQQALEELSKTNKQQVQYATTITTTGDTDFSHTESSKYWIYTKRNRW
jgi:hypothetical protein